MDDYVDCGDSNDFSFGNGTTDSPFSISAWVKMTSASNFRIVSKSNNTNGNSEYLFFVDSSKQVSLILYSALSVNRYRGRKYNITLSSYEGQWVNLITTYDGQGGINAQNGIKIYLNGTRIDNTDLSAGTYVAMPNSTIPLEIGKILSSYANGLIDEISIFNSELSASDVNTIYNSGIPGNLSSLSPLSWYRFEEGSGTTATDRDWEFTIEYRYFIN